MSSMLFTAINSKTENRKENKLQNNKPDPEMWGMPALIEEEVFRS